MKSTFSRAFTLLLLSALPSFAWQSGKPLPPVTRPQAVPRPGTVPQASRKPDVTDAKKGIIIGGAVGGAGGKFVPWGSFADLSDVAPLPGTTVNGRCAFNATYVEVNIGAAPTTPGYTNKLKVDGADAAVNNGRHLNAGQSESITTQPYLNEGSHALTLSLDDGNVVAESNESNNQFSIKYALKCRAGGQPPAGACNGKPDLVPVLPNPMNGHIEVKNIGACPAGPSKLTIDCHKQGHVGGGGGCAEIPATAAAAYQDPAFPDKVTISVPALAPGAVFSHALSFWGSLKWTSGKFDFKAMADAANAVAESDEANNMGASILTVP